MNAVVIDREVAPEVLVCENELVSENTIAGPPIKAHLWASVTQLALYWNAHLALAPSTAVAIQMSPSEGDPGGPAANADVVRFSPPAMLALSRFPFSRVWRVVISDAADRR